MIGDAALVPATVSHGPPALTLPQVGTAGGTAEEGSASPSHASGLSGRQGPPRSRSFHTEPRTQGTPNSAGCRYPTSQATAGYRAESAQQCAADVRHTPVASVRRTHNPGLA